MVDQGAGLVADAGYVGEAVWGIGARVGRQLDEGSVVLEDCCYVCRRTASLRDVSLALESLVVRTVKSCRSCAGAISRVLELEDRLAKATGVLILVANHGDGLPENVRSDVGLIASSGEPQDRSLSLSGAISILWDVYRSMRPEGHVGHALIDHPDLGRVCCMPGCDLCRLQGVIENALKIRV